MKIHFIAIGGSVMHNFAIALHKIGHEVTGSDDEIYDPAKTRLANHGLLPESYGWHPERITEDIEAVILGMHAKAGNPELEKARALGLRIYSFPEFIYEQSKHKHRVVICGSHGKTTITSMVMHVMRCLGREFDYLVGGQIQGFDTMVKLSNDAPMIILEGDEYLASPLDKRPKFLLYKPHLALISGIAWDHINVFPTEEAYTNQFVQLVKSMPKAGMLVYNDEDKGVRRIIKQHARSEEHYLHPYKNIEHRIRDGRYEVKLKGKRMPVSVIGKHNMSNMAGAWEVCRLLAVDPEDFLKHIATFTGASKRLEKIYEDDDNNIIFKDFAHSPSKVKATVEAVRDVFSRRNIVACLELHTFSSLNKAFLHQYRKTLKAMKNKIVFVNEHTLKMKNYPSISRAELIEAFEDEGIEYATTVEELRNLVRRMRSASNNVFLMMSSGNFGNEDLEDLALGGV
ncbi:MAG: Mur ligase family protein [Bacteroidota bacterium]